MYPQNIMSVFDKTATNIDLDYYCYARGWIDSCEYPK